MTSQPDRKQGMSEQDRADLSVVAATTDPHRVSPRERRFARAILAHQDRLGRLEDVVAALEALCDDQQATIDALAALAEGATTKNAGGSGGAVDREAADTATDVEDGGSTGAPADLPSGACPPPPSGSPEPEHVTCPTCGGSGVAVSETGPEYHCRRCGGEGRLRVWVRSGKRYVVSGETRHPQNGEAFLSGDMVVTDSRCPAEPGETCNTSAPILVPAPPPEGAEDRSSSEGDGSGEAVDQRTVRAARGGEHVPGAGATGGVVHDDHVGRLSAEFAPIEGPPHEPQDHLDHAPSVVAAALPERPHWWPPHDEYVARWANLSLDEGSNAGKAAVRLARQVGALQEALRWALLNGNGPTEEALSPEARWALHTTLNTQEDTST